MANDYLLQEDGVSKLILEDGSGDLILESSTGGAQSVVPILMRQYQARRD
jgi:hypothetical protein